MSTATTKGRRLLSGYAVSLGAAAVHGVGTLISQKVVTDYAPPMVATGFSTMFGAVIMGALFYRHALGDLAAAPRSALVYVALGGLASAWGLSFLYLGLNVAPAVLVAPLTGTHPLVSILIAYSFLRRFERVTWRTVFGAVLVVSGVALIAVGRG